MNNNNEKEKDSISTVDLIDLGADLGDLLPSSETIDSIAGVASDVGSAAGDVISVIGDILSSLS